MDRTPPIPEEVVLWLETLFPDRCQKPAATLAEIRIAQGQVSVVRKVRQTFEEQGKNVLNL